MASSPRILPYVDIPLQHINDQMLRRMSRRVTRSETEALLDKLRRRIPNLTIRTTLITGFPGETDAEFRELCEFVRQQRFDRMGVFTYSYEADTPSGKLPDHIAEELKASRREELMAIQLPIARENNQAKVGRPYDVILDGPVPDEDNVWVGRTVGDAPEVDGVVYVTGDRQNLQSGDIVPCEVVGVQDYDLIAVAIDKPRPRGKARPPRVVSLSV
jgi:ribosomal protein S12 methylthiotransferase